jgi:uncharacterized membrane protein YraQ (UPF0718 family)
MDWIWPTLQQAFQMFWQTLWALVMGFGISAALQVFISKEQMTRAFGTTSLRSMSLATLLGAASSSCSYAAVAAGRSAFQKGAALIPVLAFMFASTNLVIELGAMIWVLMGWHFVLAEVAGSLVLIAIMWTLVRFFVPKNLENEARARSQEVVETIGHCCDHGEGSPADGRLARLATAFVMDWRMIWKELTIGFLVAGFLAATVPASWWRALFMQEGPEWLRLVENAAVGPLIGVASWVCSCANIPLASLLWTNGISFGGVISFIYADLIVVPIILIYRKYFGGRAAVYITVIFYVSMVIAGVLVDLAFKATGLVPVLVHAHGEMAHAVVGWNYTTWLNLVAILVASVLFFASRRKRDAP